MSGGPSYTEQYAEFRETLIRDYQIVSGLDPEAMPSLAVMNEFNRIIQAHGEAVKAACIAAITDGVDPEMTTAYDCAEEIT